MRTQEEIKGSPRATLYIHLPFCRSKCAYCDFYSAPAGSRAAVSYSDYVDALICEWHMRKGETGEKPGTIYLGGGTPSLLPVEELRRLLCAVGEDVEISSLSEVTVEANPEDVTPEWLDEIRSAGISRVSIGVQSFNEDELAAVSRRHSPTEALRAIEALSAGGWNYSADLIYGLPGQSLDSWRKNLRRLLDFRPPHFSAYLLSYEEGTALYARLMKGKVEEASDELVTEMYSLLCLEAAEAGYEHYEISNFALPGRRAIHNSAYWDGTPYLGLGAGAHSLGADGIRRFNPPSARNYCKAISEGRTFFEVDEETPENRVNDLIITALRTNRGLSVGSVPEKYRPELLKGIAEAIRCGDLQETGGGNVRIPESRWLRSDAIMRNLIV